MKKSFFAVIIVSAFCALALPVFAEKAGATGTVTATGPVANFFVAFPSGISGDYVVYRDYTWKAPTWIGFLYYDDSTYGAVAVTPSTGSKVAVLFSTEIVDGKMILTGQNVVSKITPDDVVSVNYLMTLLPKMWSWRSHPVGSAGTIVPAGKAGSARSGLLPPVVRTAMSLEDFGGNVTQVWAPEIPVFNLLSLVATGEKPVMELARMGRIRSGGEAAFFGFSPTPEAKPGVALSIPSQRKVETRTVDGVKLALDSQWTMVADNTYFLGDAAVILVDTLDLALMQVPSGSLPLSMVRLFSLSSDQSWSYPGALSVSGNAKDFRITNLFYDAKTGMINRDIKTCRPSADGKKCTVISLSVSETAYQSNAAYFDSLF